VAHLLLELARALVRARLDAELAVPLVRRVIGRAHVLSVAARPVCCGCGHSYAASIAPAMHPTTIFLTSALSSKKLRPCAARSLLLQHHCVKLTIRPVGLPHRPGPARRSAFVVDQAQASRRRVSAEGILGAGPGHVPLRRRRGARPRAERAGHGWSGHRIHRLHRRGRRVETRMPSSDVSAPPAPGCVGWLALRASSSTHHAAPPAPRANSRSPTYRSRLALPPEPSDPAHVRRVVAARRG